MKKRIGLFSFMVFFGVFLLAGCDPIKPENPEIENVLPNNELVSIMKDFADAAGVSYSNIKQDNYEWYNYAENDYEISDIVGGYYDISGYSLLATGLKETVNTSKVFDGWYVYYIGDEMLSSAIEYSKDNIVCYYYQGLEEDIPYELLAWEGDYEDEEEVEAYNKAREDFYKTASYEVELYCGYIPEGVVQYKDLYFDGEGMEPFWRASIRGSLISIFTPTGMEEDYLATVKSNGDDIEFKGYHIKNGKLEKANCVDGGKGDNHEYKISFDFVKSFYGDDGLKYDEEATHYEGCADSVEFDFVDGEEGMLNSFIEKTDYVYKRNFNQDYVYYTISDIVDNYMSVDFYENDGENYDSYQAIMEKTDEGWKVLFEGEGYEISDDECERLNQYDNNLMDMFFLVRCPRG